LLCTNGLPLEWREWLNMRVYVAATISDRENVRHLYRCLTELGHTVTVDWTHSAPIPILERERNASYCQKVAVEDFAGVMNCDVFILLADPAEGRGKYVELGAAMGSAAKTGSPTIFVLGQEVNQSIFYYHPLIKRRTSLETLLAELQQATP
jgi:hypothetical protein